MAEVSLLVNNRRYRGWESIRIDRSIENIAGSFTLSVNDRWASQDEPWPIAEEDECRVEIDGEIVIDGWIDRRTPQLDGATRRLTFTGRDRAGALVDNSTILDQWSFRNASVLDIAQKVADPFGITISVAPGVTIEKIKKLVVNPGDRAFNVIARAAEPSGVLAVSDGVGGVVLTRSGTARATALVEGVNIHAITGDFNAAQRYYRYVVASQAPGTNNANGEALRVLAEAFDEEVRRTDRVLWIRPDQGMDKASAKRRADWEARIRAAKADSVTATVLEWRQPSGELWTPNYLIAVKSPGVGVNGDMLIANVGHSISQSGVTTDLRLVRPDAFTPSPQAVVRRSSGGAWKELAGGAL